jgi:hypothetical protein
MVLHLHGKVNIELEENFQDLNYKSFFSSVGEKKTNLL